MRHVQVLLSAYNGSNYLAQQIESILDQKQVKVSLMIRDDGSTDTTKEILKKYSGKNVCIYAGQNIGTQKSFFDLLTHADAENDYFAFSDQDDVWHPRKLQRAVQVLESQTESSARPLLYAGRVIYSSHDLRIKKKWKRPLRKIPSFGNALVENICMGCTQVFNRQLLELVRNHPPHSTILHDWWLYMSAAYFGTVVFDEHAYILYRQHENNQVGMQSTWLECQLARLRRARQLRGIISAQAADFASVYEKERAEKKRSLADADSKRCEQKKCSLADAGFRSYEQKSRNFTVSVSNSDQNELLELAAHYRHDWRKKLAAVTGNEVYRQNRMDHLVFRVLFGIGYL